MAQISVLLKSKTERNRLDSEFYLPSYLKLIQDLRQIPNNNLGTICYVTSGSTPPERDASLKEGIVLLKTQNIQDGYIDITKNVSYINEKLDERLRNTRLKPKDVLLNIVGATLEVIGRAGIVPVNFPRANITQAMALIRVKSEDFHPEYVFAFLCSRYGRLQVCRLARPTGQFNINHPEIRAILIPKASIDFQKHVADLVSTSLQLRDKSQQVRDRSESIILKTLKFDELPKHFVSEFIVNRSECIENNRIDSEYYRPEYKLISEKVEKVARDNSWKVTTVKEISEPLRYGTSERLTYLDEGTPFLRITDVQDMDFDREKLRFISEKEANRVNYARVREGDLVVSRSGTLGLTVPIRKDLNGSIFGSYFIRVRPRTKIDNEYLALYLNSFFGQIQVRQMCTGAVQRNLTIPIIENIKVLKPDTEFQEKIASLLTESKHLKERAKNILKDVIVKIESEIKRNQKS